MPKLHYGYGAECTILTRFIHPSAIVQEKYSNLEKTYQTLVVLVGEETKTGRKQQQNCYTFLSNDFQNIVLYAVKRHLQIVKEVIPDGFFGEGIFSKQGE